MEENKKNTESYEASNLTSNASQHNNQFYSQPQHPATNSSESNHAYNADNDEGHGIKEKLQLKEELLKDLEKKIEELQCCLRDTSAQIKDRDWKIEYLLKEDNEMRDANSRPINEKEIIKDLKTKLDAQSAEIAALLTSGVKLVEDMDIEIGKYNGPLRDGLPHGVGEWVDEYGSIFTGTWQNGKREGLFAGKNVDGTVYESNYRDGELHGYQKETWSDGRIDESNYKEGKLHGYKKRTWSDKTVYEWNFKDGYRQGYQKTTWSDGTVEEEIYKDGNLHGYQKETSSDGTVYECNYKDAELHGCQKGTESDGTIYDRNFKDGKIHGEFKSIYPDGRATCEYYENGNLML